MSHFSKDERAIRQVTSPRLEIQQITQLLNITLKHTSYEHFEYAPLTFPRASFTLHTGDFPGKNVFRRRHDTSQRVDIFKQRVVIITRRRNIVVYFYHGIPFSNFFSN